MTVRDLGFARRQDIGDVSINNVLVSSKKLSFASVEGPYEIQANRDILRLLAAHGGRPAGRNVLEPRALRFDMDQSIWHVAESRAELLAFREEIVNDIIVPALRDEVEIYFHETQRSIWGTLRGSVLGDGKAFGEREMERFMKVGMHFICSDPLLYSPAIVTEAVPMVVDQQRSFELGHLDSFVELRFFNNSGSTVTSGAISVQDLVSGAVFTFDPALRNIPALHAVRMLSREYDVYVFDSVNGTEDRAGVWDAVTSQLPLPLLSRAPNRLATLKVLAAPAGFLWGALYRRTYLTL